MFDGKLAKVPVKTERSD